VAKDITIDDILQDLQAVEPIILQYEQKYRLLSPYFYRLYQKGKLEERWDFMDWAALYEIKLDREKEYEKRLSDVLKNLPLEEHVEEDMLMTE
jgi:hypothetical protein